MAKLTRIAHPLNCPPKTSLIRSPSWSGVTMAMDPMKMYMIGNMMRLLKMPVMKATDSEAVASFNVPEPAFRLLT